MPFHHGQKPTTNLTLDQRYTLATAIVNTVKGLFNASDGTIDGVYLNSARANSRVAQYPSELGFGDSGSLLTAMALMDRVNGSSLYSEIVLDNLDTAINTSPPEIAAKSCAS